MASSVPQKSAPHRSAIVLPLVLLCVLFAGLFIVVRIITIRLEALASLRLQERADAITLLTQARLDQYSGIVSRGAEAFGNGPAVLSPSGWQRHFAIQTAQDRVSLQALIFVRRVSDTELIDTFVEPIQGNEALVGFNAASDPVQKAAMDAAARDASVQATGFLGATDETLMIFAPIYQAQKLVGYDAALIKADTLFKGMLADFNGSLTGLWMSVLDDQSMREMLISGPADGASLPLKLNQKVVFGQRTFHLVFRAGNQFGLSDYEANLPITIAIIGGLLSVAMFGFALYVSRSRMRGMKQIESATHALAEKTAELVEKNKQLQVADQGRTQTLDLKVRELEDSKAAMINVLEDLTIAKDAIEAARAYDEALLESIADGVIAMDTKGVVTTINPATAQLFGYESHEVIGKDALTVFELCTEDGTSVPREERNFTQVLSLGSPKVITDRNHYYRHKDGTIFPVAVDLSPITEKGAIVGAIEVVRDITKEKEVDRAKSEFVSLASHQLRTPLTAVGWYTELLAAPDAGPEEQKEYIKEIRGANKRMVDLVDALLNVSRIELGTFTVDPKPVDLVVLVKDSIAEMSAYVAKKNLHLVEWYEREPLMFSVDTTLMRMMVTNLLSNGVKYTPANGTVTVKVGTKQGRLAFTVSDTGVGIPAKDQPEIFKRMFRTDQGRLLDPDGTGLGLYLVKSIVDSSGGEISFQSEEGKGTTFTITYPATGMKPRAGNRRLRPTAAIHEL